ncbi:MAG: class I SAM-dependent methyltransferase [Anaerolineae bacterium]
MREYDRVDASFYDFYSLGLPGDVEFYVEAARQAESDVLELGCGTGRILIPMAEAGLPVVGLDRSDEMLARARKKIAGLPVKTRRRCKLVQGDMRDFALRRQFKLIIIPYRAFLHLLTPADQRQALLNIREHLADDGRLIINIFDPRLDLIAAHAGPLGAALKKEDEFIHPETKRHVVVWDSRQYDPGEQTVDQLFIYEELDDEGRSLTRVFSTYTLRYLYRQEMEYLLELCGYRVDALYGDFQRGPFRYGGEQIWVAQKLPD